MSTRLLRTVGQRLYGNFALPDRTGIYRDLLAGFAARGYVSLTIAAFARLRLSGERLPERVLLLRHDIDTG